MIRSSKRLWMHLVLVAAMAAGLAHAAGKSPWEHLDPAGFEKLAKEKHVILDVRSPEEFAAGHIAGAINIDIDGRDFDQKTAQLKKDQVHLVYCASGVRSVRACNKMAKAGFAQLYNLKGGIVAWKREGKEVRKD